MGWWTEIQNVDHAEACIKKWFGPLNGLKEFSQMAAFLSNAEPYKGAFETALEGVSADVWKTYLEIKEGSNRLTRAIQKAAGDYGFAMHTANRHVVYIGNVSEDKFLSNLTDKVLWKDSFGLGHGEFSHSYQWLAAGKHFKWGSGTAELYSRTTAKSLTGVELFHLLDKQIVKSEVPLWLWLVDSVPVKENATSMNGWTSEHGTLNGHCFTEQTFRNANLVHTTLRKKANDWFLGWYAEHRNQKLLDLEAATVKRLVGKDKEYPSLKKMKVDYPSPTDRQQKGLRDLYGTDQAVVERDLRLTGQKKDDWGEVKSFHNVEGLVPKKKQ